MSYVLLLRPKSWIKNFVILLPLIFSGKVLYVNSVFSSFFLFLLFSFFVGGTYIVNDLCDVENDKKHPQKKYRPIASGRISPFSAGIFAFFIISFSLLLCFYFYSFSIFLFFLLYWINTSIYSLFLKRKPILDVFSIAFWFVIRGVLWIIVISWFFSPWFFMILFFWSLWLWFVKRYQELSLWMSTRSVLLWYGINFLEQIISIMTAVLLVSYALYTIESTQSQWFLLTLPLVVFLVIRIYYHIFFLKKYDLSFEDIILSDFSILFSSFLFFIISSIIVLLN